MPQATAAQPTVTRDKSSQRRRWIMICGVASLLLILFLQLMLSVRQESVSWDESDHLFSGYMSWKHDDFGLNPEHPPLIKFVAALPLLDMHLRVPPLQHRSFKTEAFFDGRDFMSWNYSKGILFRARMAVSIFALLLGLLIFLAGREMFGTAAGFIGLALFAFAPNFLAHGALVATDVGVSCFIFASVYTFYRYVKKPSLGRLLVAGIATGLAFGSKHTGILLLPMLLLLIACEMLRPHSSTAPGESRPRRALRLAGAYIVTVLIAFLVLWSLYGFRYKARPAGLKLNPPLTSYIASLSKPFEEAIIGTCAHYHLLPESYLEGMADIQHVDDQYTSYFFGKIYPHGNVWYFPAVIAIKSTLPFLILLFATAILIAIRKFTYWREILFLVVPCVVYMAVAMSFQMNIGLRHILPVYAVLYVLIAGGASVLLRLHRRWVYAIAVLLVWQAFEAIHIFPAYMAYGNELWGGPSQVHKYLSDSNVDWGQQLIAVKHYLDKNKIANCWMLYFPEGVVDPSTYGIPCKLLPTSEMFWWINQPLNTPPSINGTVLVSASDVAGFEFGPPPLNPYQVFKTAKPVAVIQDGIYVYQGHFDIPLAAAYSHDQNAENLLKKSQPQTALTEATQALALAPNEVIPNETMGDVLEKLDRSQQAHAYYQKALHLAEIVQPQFQIDEAAALRQKLEHFH